MYTLPSSEKTLTHWGRVTRMCVGKLAIVGSDNGLSSGWRQAIIWANAGILLIGPLGTNFSEILIVIQTFSFKKMHLKMSSATWRQFCLGLNVLTLRCFPVLADQGRGAENRLLYTCIYSDAQMENLASDIHMQYVSPRHIFVLHFYTFQTILNIFCIFTLGPPL